MALPGGYLTSSPESVAIKAGERAPFSGILLTNEAAADLVAATERCLTQSEYDLKLCEEVGTTKLEAEIQRGRAREAACDARVRACETEARDMAKAYDKELKVCRNAAWVPYATAAAGVLLGGLTGAGICAAR